jgi:hypothetical protein
LWEEGAYGAVWEDLDDAELLAIQLDLLVVEGGVGINKALKLLLEGVIVGVSRNTL